MSAPAKAEHGVNRLLDIVAEEVSLVDRAANKHRFLIVKRSNDMDQTTTDAAATAADETDDVQDLAAETDDEQTANGAENDATNGGEAAGHDSPLGSALAALDTAGKGGGAAAAGEGDAGKDTGGKPAAGGAGGTSDGVASHLEAVATALRTLTETVKEQQQRLGRIEKRFGLPNSAPSGERPAKADDEEVGWPLDLNRPFDRESVDKATSFHDL